MKKLTKEKITKIFEEVFNKQDKRENRKIGLHKLGWIHNTWEENGEKFSSWTFNSRNGSFTTGDGGKAEFDKLMAEEINKTI